MGVVLFITVLRKVRNQCILCSQNPSTVRVVLTLKRKLCLGSQFCQLVTKGELSASSSNLSILYIEPNRFQLFCFVVLYSEEPIGLLVVLLSFVILRSLLGLFLWGASVPLLIQFYISAKKNNKNSLKKGSGPIVQY